MKCACVYIAGEVTELCGAHRHYYDELLAKRKKLNTEKIDNNTQRITVEVSNDMATVFATMLQTLINKIPDQKS